MIFCLKNHFLQIFPMTKATRSPVSFRTNTNLLGKLDLKAKELEISRNCLLNIFVSRGLDDELFLIKYTSDFPLRIAADKV
jgi:hypothetical protein